MYFKLRKKIYKKTQPPAAFHKLLVQSFHYQDADQLHTQKLNSSSYDVQVTSEMYCKLAQLLTQLLYKITPKTFCSCCKRKSLLFSILSSNAFFYSRQNSRLASDQHKLDVWRTTNIQPARMEEVCFSAYIPDALLPYKWAIFKQT